MKEYQSLSHTRWDCKCHVVVCCEHNRRSSGGSDASSKMREGPSKSAGKGRLQTASSCVG